MARRETLRPAATKGRVRKTAATTGTAPEANAGDQPKSAAKAKSPRKPRQPELKAPLIAFGQAHALLSVSIAHEYGTVDPTEWADLGNGTVMVASREESEENLRNRVCFGTGGVPRERAWITEVGRETRDICGSNAPAKMFVLVKVMALR